MLFFECRIKHNLQLQLKHMRHNDGVSFGYLFNIKFRKEGRLKLRLYDISDKLTMV